MLTINLMRDGMELVPVFPRDPARPRTFPQQLRHGPYVATFTGVDERFRNDPCASARWDIILGDQVVGVMHEGNAYGWGRPCFSLSKLWWSGPCPSDASDSRSENYGMCFDGSNYTSHAEALAEFAKRADRLIEWRRTAGEMSRTGQVVRSIEEG